MRNAVRSLVPALTLAVVFGCGKASKEPPQALAPAVPPAPTAPAPAATVPTAPPPAQVTVEESQPQPGAPKTAPSKPRVTKAVQVRRVDPQYPDVAKKMRLEGIVTLVARVKSDGSVDQVKVVNGIHPLLDGSAERAVQQWRYDPATVDGRRVPSSVKVTVGFKL